MTHPTRPWDLVINLGGSAISSRVSGVVSVKAVEGGSRTAQFEYLPPAGAIDPNSWAGKSVTIDYEDASLVLHRIFTGVVDVPTYDINTRRVRFQCTQNRDELFAAYTEGQLATLITGSYWSKHIFDEKSDIPRKAEDRLLTVSASLDFNGSNTAVLTDWAAKVTPDFTIPAADVSYGSVAVSLASRDDLRNSIDVKFKYRFTRLRHREHVYQWDYPGSPDPMTSWVLDPTTLPYRDQILQAAESTGLQLRPGYTFDALGNSGWYGGIFFVVAESERLKYALGADFTLARRFSQSVTEDYTVTVKAPQSITQHGAIAESATYGMTAEYDASDWDDLDSYEAPAGTQSANGDYIQDMTGAGIDGGRTEFDEAIKCAQAIARVQILASHRKNYVDFTLKIPKPQLELLDTVQLNSTPVTAKGTVAELEHLFSINGPSAWEQRTRVRLAVSKVENAPPTENAIGVPTAPDTSDAGPAPGTIILGNHYGNHAASPAYDETWDGSIGNYSTHDAVQTMEIYPEAFIVDAPEVADADRLDREVSAASNHDIAIPNETLTLN